MRDIRLDPAGLLKVLSGGAAAAALQRRAQRTAADARSGPRGRHGGRHEVDLIAVGATRITDEGAVVDIDWPSPFRHLIEFGSANNPPYRPVTRAAQNNGLRVVDRRSR